MENLDRKNVAILATNGFEESELREPKKALEKAGANVHIVSLESGEIKSWFSTIWFAKSGKKLNLGQMEIGEKLIK